MEPIKEEGSRSALEPFPDHDVIPDFHIVDGSPASMAEKTRPKKKLRFQRNRGSVDSEMSDMGHSVFTEPERPAAYPPKWRMGMLDESAIGGIPGAWPHDRVPYMVALIQIRFYCSSRSRSQMGRVTWCITIRILLTFP